MIVDQRQVQRLRGLVVVITELVARVLVQIEEVVVDVQHLKAQPSPLQSRFQFLGGGGLAGRRGTGDQHQAHVVAARQQQLGRGGDIVFVGGFRLVHDLGEFTGGDTAVSRATVSVRGALPNPAPATPWPRESSG